LARSVLRFCVTAFAWLGQHAEAIAFAREMDECVRAVLVGDAEGPHADGCLLGAPPPLARGAGMMRV
jgi:hypothetical protein